MSKKIIRIGGMAVIAVMMTCGMMDRQTASPAKILLSTEMPDPTEDNGPVLLIAPYARESDLAKAMAYSKGVDWQVRAPN
jgi:hypothetical protein